MGRGQKSNLQWLYRPQEIFLLVCRYLSQACTCAHESSGHCAEFGRSIHNVHMALKIVRAKPALAWQAPGCERTSRATPAGAGNAILRQRQQASSVAG